jgi:hypothetical protein
MKRRVCSRADLVLRDRFRLDGWVCKLNERRDLYFGWCDRATQDLMLLNGGSTPKDESLILLLMAALAEDESFAGHVLRNRRAEFLADNSNWDKLYRAGAATILEEYLADVENGRWP